MHLSRRQFLTGTLALAAAGCSQPMARPHTRPGPLWPALSPRPDVAGQARTVEPAPVLADVPPATTGIGDLMPRAAWTSRSPVGSKLNAMGGITRITVHHEGWKPVWFSDPKSTAERLELIRESHLGRGWADIGYHYVIDRAGRLWEGRSTRFQGAHVRDENEHNLAVMLLGNFDLQQPSDAQYTRLIDTLRKLRQHHSVPVTRIYTHQELKPTACPGRALQPKMVSLRQSRTLA